MAGAIMKDDSATLSSFGLYDDLLNPPSTSSGGIFDIAGWSWGGSKKKKERREKRIILVGGAQASVSDRPDLKPQTSAPVGKIEEEMKKRGLAFPGSPAAEMNGEDEAIKKIRAILEESKAFQSKLEELEVQAGISSPSPTSISTAPAPRPSRSPVSSTTPQNGTSPGQTAVYINEMLLKSVMKLDEVKIEPEWQEARSERKGGIRALQACMDRVDRVKEILK